MSHYCHIPSSAIGASGGEQIRLSLHAVSRFQERVFRRPSEESARRLLTAAIQRGGRVSLTRPDWVWPKPSNPAVAWIILGREIVLPVCRRDSTLVAVTTLVRPKESTRVAGTFNGSPPMNARGLS
jgi:hypothetical protein